MIILTTALLMMTAQGASVEEKKAASDASHRAQEAYSKCMYFPGGALAKLPATATPEEGAKIALKACDAERAKARELQGRQFALVFPPKDAAVARANALKGDSEKMVAGTIRLQRANAANDACIKGEIAKLAASVTPEEGAETIFKACAAQRTVALKAMLAQQQMRGMTDEWSRDIIEQYKAQIRNDKDEVIAAKEALGDRIRMSRKSPPAPKPAQ